MSKNVFLISSYADHLEPIKYLLTKKGAFNSEKQSVQTSSKLNINTSFPNNCAIISMNFLFFSNFRTMFSASLLKFNTLFIALSEALSVIFQAIFSFWNFLARHLNTKSVREANIYSFINQDFN